MQVTKQLTGVAVTTALTMSSVVGGASVASASQVAPDEAATVLSDESSVHMTAPGLDGTGGAGADYETRAVPVIAIITTVILAGGAAYAMGEKAALRAYYAGLRNGQWQSVKWQARATAVGMMGPVGGPIFMTGFENKFYSLI